MLPDFVYHPDPVATGSVVAADVPCECCGRARGHVYRGPVHAVDEVTTVCPWCIADGSAAERWDARFTHAHEVPSEVPAEVVEEICRRTPGYTAWQQDGWRFHCGDGAAFLGLAGWPEVQGLPDAVADLRLQDADDDVLPLLRKDGDVTAYLFRCRVCRTHLASWDAS